MCNFFFSFKWFLYYDIIFLHFHFIDIEFFFSFLFVGYYGFDIIFFLLLQYWLNGNGFGYNRPCGNIRKAAILLIISGDSQNMFEFFNVRNIFFFVFKCFNFLLQIKLQIIFPSKYYVQYMFFIYSCRSCMFLYRQKQLYNPKWFWV